MEIARLFGKIRVVFNVCANSKLGTQKLFLLAWLYFREISRECTEIQIIDDVRT